MKNENIQKILFFLILINPLLSLFFDDTSVRYHYILLPLVYILCFILSTKSKKDFFKLLFASFFTISSISIAIVQGCELGKIHNHLFNFLSFISLCVIFSNNEFLLNFKNYISYRKKFVFIILFIINIVELYMFVTKKGFFYRFSWGGTFFKGTSSMPHTLSYLMLTTIIYSLVLFFISKNKKVLLLSILPFFLIFESGARVSLILASILALFEIDVAFSKNQKSKIVKLTKLLIILGIFFIIFRNKIMESDLMSKILKRSSSEDSSAGRTVLWFDLLNRFIAHPSKWLFGFGDDKVYYYSGINQTIGESIWAHNDFVQVLFGKGILGIISYFTGLISYIKSVLKNNGNYYSYFIIIFILIAAFLNGFYSYRDLMLAIPLIYIVNIYLYNKKQVGDLLHD